MKKEIVTKSPSAPGLVLMAAMVAIAGACDEPSPVVPGRVSAALDDDTGTVDAAEGDEDANGNLIVTVDLPYGPPPPPHGGDGGTTWPDTEAYGICGLIAISGQFVHVSDSLDISVNISTGYYQITAMQDADSNSEGLTAPAAEWSCADLSSFTGLPEDNGKPDGLLTLSYGAADSYDSTADDCDPDSHGYPQDPDEQTVDSAGRNGTVWRGFNGAISDSGWVGVIPSSGNALVYPTNGEDSTPPSGLCNQTGTVTLAESVFALSSSDVIGTLVRSTQDRGDVGSSAFVMDYHNPAHTWNDDFFADLVDGDEFGDSPNELEYDDHWCTLSGLKHLGPGDEVEIDARIVTTSVGSRTLYQFRFDADGTPVGATSSWRAHVHCFAVDQT